MKLKRHFSNPGIAFLIIMTMTACGMKNSEPAAEESVKESVSAEAEPESLAESLPESLIESSPESLPESIPESISEPLPESTPEPETDVQQEEPAPEPLEFYKCLIGEDAQRAYDADNTYSLTWNPDGSSQYDTITATLYRYNYMNDSSKIRTDMVVNGKTYELTFQGPGVVVDIFVTDVDKTDEYKNILVAQSGDEWGYTVHIFAYKGDELTEINTVDGELLPETLNRDGSFETYFRRTWRAGDNDFIVFKGTHGVHGPDYTLLDEKAGVLDNINEGVTSHFTEGYEVRLISDVYFYNDPEKNDFGGTVKAGSVINITGYGGLYGGALKFQFGDVEGWIEYVGPDVLENYYYFC